MKIMYFGILICLLCLYLILAWEGTEGFVIGAYGFPVGFIIALVGLSGKWPKNL